MTSRPVVLAAPANYETLCTRGHALLREAGYEVRVNPHDRPLLPEEVRAYAPEIDAAVVGVEAWPREIIDLAPSLRALTKVGVGVDNIDIAAASARGIAVVNAPGGNANAVAEFVIGMLLGLVRHIPEMDADVRAGRWPRRIGNEISGRTVGLVGFGAIGRLVARKLRGFDVEVIAWDPFPQQHAADQLGVTLLERDEVMSRSDIVSLHVPLLPETAEMMNSTEFAKMKPGALLVNAARGGLVDHHALREALLAGRLGGAALDVFDVEPVPADHPVLGLENVLLTTHSAADSAEAYELIGVLNAQAIIDTLEGRTPQNLVNPA